MTYYEAINHFPNTALILCNNIAQIDPTVWDNSEFVWEDDLEIFQWYLTNLTQDDVCYLAKKYNLLFTYSELLDMYVLCVDHYGTDWKYVEI